MKIDPKTEISKKLTQHFNRSNKQNVCSIFKVNLFLPISKYKVAIISPHFS